MAVVAPGRPEGHDLIDPVGGQQLFQMGRVARLAATLAFGLLLGDRLGCVEGIGGRREGRVGAVGAQPCLEVADAPLQLGDASEMGEASRARDGFHRRILSSQIASSVPIA